MKAPMQALKALMGPAERLEGVEAKPRVGPLMATGIQPSRLAPRMGHSHRHRGPEVGWERTDSDLKVLEDWGLLPPAELAVAVAAAERPAATGLVDTAKFRQRRGRYGLKGLPTNGRRNLSGLLALLEEQRKRLGFWTITLPGPVLDAIARNDSWPAFQEAVVRKLRRLLLRRLGYAIFAGCVELQPHRSRIERRPCPHLHIVYIARQAGRSTWAVTKDELDEIIEAAAREAGFDGAADFSSAGNIQRVERSVRSYLSKYMTKGSSDVAQWVGTRYEALIPRQWWLWTKEAAALLESCTIDLPTPFVAWVWRARARLLEQGRIWLNAYPHREGVPATYRVGWLNVANLAQLLAEWQEAMDVAMVDALLEIGVVPEMGRLTYAKPLGFRRREALLPV